MSHPSLTVIKEILQSNIKRSSLKALIVAEKFFWWSLKSLLLSLGLSFNEIKNFHANQPDLCNNTVEFRNAEMKDLLASDCLLVSPEHVSAIFPFNKFSIILEYGGSYRSSRISYLSPSLVGLPHIHFLKVDLGGSFKLCEGVEMPQDIEMLTEEESDCGRNNKKLKKQLNFCPQEDKYERRSSKAAGEVEDCSMVLPISPGMGSGQSHQNMESSHGAEREGVQVVERDAVWPVDIIISSSICLVWYASGNIGKKATPINEACSCLPLCIDNIATNVLTMLSFTFSGCFLVFEGQTDFVLTVMESSDGLYAAAASLGIDLQLFFSYSSEMTNEIIVNCIKYATKLTRGLYPKMPEIFVLQKYNVPDESVALFSAFCRYGEREDSKSIMTDCSSSVSSGPDSDRNQICKFVPLEGILDSSTISKSCNLRVSKDPGTSDDLGKASFSMNDLFGQRQGQDVAMMRNASRPTRTSYDSRSFNSSQITNDEMNKPCLSLNDKLLAQNRILETAIMDKQLERNCVPKSQNLHEDISGEVIDLT
ncbi:Protein SHORTAGE IN CHIASMATA 1 [Quillaja saponaria]|uniref:Protein SHORTAGE IN CHIASMATA 1 n=1 Tax=Quillaja saponaria TaxID=32244 RepID=A0AAD7Q3M4_QUISA|nr:Protein SHORTAGE IN CHIASMATA 1 [Quillaja saponaria]